jgi:DNA-binding NarL/FixJ family response regulator
MRVVIADDGMLLRSGLARLLIEAGVEVVGEASDADTLLHLVRSERPDVAIVDIRMPLTQTDEGLQAARLIRSLHPDTAVVLLSQHIEARYAQRLLADQPGGVGYLLKERVADIAVLIDALRRVTNTNCVPALDVTSAPIDGSVPSSAQRERSAANRRAPLVFTVAGPPRSASEGPEGPQSQRGLETHPSLIEPHARPTQRMCADRRVSGSKKLSIRVKRLVRGQGGGRLR